MSAAWGWRRRRWRHEAGEEGCALPMPASWKRMGRSLRSRPKGYAKQSPLSDYSRQGRNGSGIVTHKLNSRTGDVAGALVLLAGLAAETLILVTSHKAVVKSIA
ncbi:MAG: hypothetical protein R3E79_17315 [Caldilineaceae bacterium]